MILSEPERAWLHTREHPPTTDRSQLAQLLQPFWNSALRLVPTTVAPNTLTVMGSLAVVVPTLLALHTSPQLQTAVPAWIIVLQILGVFVFQTLDALDGKQARRVNASSPLGSWLDHSLDIVTMQFVLIGVCASVRAGLGFATWAVLAGALLNSYLLHWESSHTRALILGNGTSITDAQCLVMLYHAAALVFPSLFSSTLAELLPALATLPYSDAALCSWLLVSSVIIVGGAGALASVRRALAVGTPRIESARRLVSIVVLLLPTSWVWLSAIDSQSRLVLGGAVFMIGSRAVARVVLENLLRRAPSTFDLPCLVACALAIGFAVAPSLVSWFDVWALLGATAALLSYLFTTGRGLAEALGERVFSLEREPS